MLGMNYLHRDIVPELRARRMERSPGVGQAVNLLSPEQQIRLQSIAALVDVPRGGLIFGEGNPADFLFVMARGMARISRVSLSGRRQVMAFKMAGDLLGYPEQGIYVNTGRALSIVTIYRIPWRKLSVLLRRDPEMHASFLTRMAFDVRQAQKRIMALGQQNVGQRLSSFLLDLMEYSEFYDPQCRQLSLLLTRFDLADYLGTTPETVVRILARLEHDGLIRRLTARLLEIRDADGLARLLEERRRTG
jgi:CRP-like cAMP-binding protein